MSSTENIVVVGAGLGAVHFINALLPSLPTAHRIVVLESAQNAYWPVASLRAAVVPGWEDKPLAPLDRIFPEGSRHVVLSGTSVVELKLRSVVVDTPHPELGFSEEISFSHCVLATGSGYSFPCRPHPGASPSETAASLRSLQSAVASSSSVLIVGGGPVGLEYAGEVAAQFWKAKEGERKKITLVHSHETFFDEKEGWKEKLNRTLEKQLRDYEVELRLGRKVSTEGLETGKVEGGVKDFTLDDGSVVTADFVFIAHGSSPNTSFLSPSSSSSLPSPVLNAQNFVVVKPSFQLVSSDGSYAHLYAIGDITDVPESKVYLNAQNHGPVAAKNLLSSLSFPSSPPPKSYTAGAKAIGISIGPSGGAGQFNGWVLGSWVIGYVKAKALFVRDFKKLYKAPA